MSRLRESLKPHLCAKFNVSSMGGNFPLGSEAAQQLNFSPEKNSMGVGNASCIQQPLHTIEDEEEEMINNIPWIKVYY